MHALEKMWYGLTEWVMGGMHVRSGTALHPPSCWRIREAEMMAQCSAVEHEGVHGTWCMWMWGRAEVHAPPHDACSG